ncbi:outer membrane beta-barrel protein [Chelativorans sp. AA-79]|uniref:outer membrane beta-barrel protein n=1 Tax=Chelativorans sp. AA-79 TaxID=3028735 RepID=UPI0023F9F4A5|nr:outer membrane beta-barrel protein [Chelativorans sp. AA-79]WEX10359.1 outer membrane beta-barrel protein [Chelativorans sp. AA-79]
MAGVHFSKKRAILCLACAIGALLPALPAAGQDGALRGTLDASEDRFLAQAVGEDSGTGIPSPGYTPTSPGALPEEPDAGLPLAEDDALPADAEAEPALPEEAERAEQLEGEPEDIVTRAVPAGAVGQEELSRRQNLRQRAITGRDFDREENPYAPLGLRLGNVVVRPSIEQGLTWTSNADDSPDGEEAVLSETTLRLNATTDWSRHRAALDASTTFRKSLSGEEVRETEGDARATLEFDIAAGLTGRASLGYSFGRERASSPVSIAGVEDQPLRHTIDGSVGIGKDVGPLRLRATGEVIRNQYGDAELVGGGTLSQADRNSTLALLRLRGGYEVSPALTPFLEVEAGRRFYDQERDSAGYARSATRLGARAGVTLDLSEKLRGEVSAGWISEDFEDDRLEAVSGPTLAASLEWSPLRGTIVGLNASTYVEGSTTAGESGSLLHSATLRLERQMRSNLTGSLAFGVSYRDYSGGGHDLILNGEAALTWWVNRYVGLTGRARHERQTSDLPGRDYETTSVFMGMTLQR